MKKEESKVINDKIRWTKDNHKKTQNISWTILLISVLYVISTGGWVLTQNRSILPVMEILTIWAAIVILQFMVELYRASGENMKSRAMMALVLTSCMTAITILNHFLYMTVLNQIYIGENKPSWMLLDSWPSLTKGLECVSWGFFLGLAMLFASKVLEGCEIKVIAWTMRISGIFTLVGLIGPIVGNMNYYWLSTIGYSVGFFIISIEMISYLNRKNS